MYICSCPNSLFWGVLILVTLGGWWSLCVVGFGSSSEACNIRGEGRSPFSVTKPACWRGSPTGGRELLAWMINSAGFASPTLYNHDG